MSVVKDIYVIEIVFILTSLVFGFKCISIEFNNNYSKSQFLKVENLNTSLSYKTIQEAIDAPETLDGHILLVRSDIYFENVNIHKSLKIVGENPTDTIIDANNTGIVVSVNADNVTLTGFTIRNSGQLVPPYGDDCGLLLNHTVGGKIINNIVLNNRIGIYLFYSHANTIEQNLVCSSLENGVLLWYSGNNTLKANQIVNNSYNFGIYGNNFSHFRNTVKKDNMVDGKSIFYLTEVRDELLESLDSAGTVYLINSFNVTVQNLVLQKNVYGLFCFNTTNSRFENITASDNSYGIFIQSSSDIFIYNNNCSKDWVGICLQDSEKIIAESNIVASCEKGFSLYNARYNTLVANNILNNKYGIRLFSSHSNRIFKNNLIENNEQVSPFFSYQNSWDNGIEGNFWSDYSGCDLDRNGLGDLPYSIQSADYDTYPLLGVFHVFNVELRGKEYNFTVITNSSVLDFSFYATNNTARLLINGSDETCGFCRISIPHNLIMPEIYVIIDKGSKSLLFSNCSLRDDGFQRWIYFAYKHSVHEILIVPEFQSVCLTLVSATSICFLLLRVSRCKGRHDN
jgi:parallel beta-helix repeat protein